MQPVINLAHLTCHHHPFLFLHLSQFLPISPIQILKTIFLINENVILVTRARGHGPGLGVDSPQLEQGQGLDFLGAPEGCGRVVGESVGDAVDFLLRVTLQVACLDEIISSPGLQQFSL